MVHISNYIYTLISVRFLSPHEYSDLALVVSFYALMGVFSATLSNVALSLLSRHKDSEAYTQLKTQILHGSTIFVYLVSLFAILILTPIIHFVFNVKSILEIIIILIAGVFPIGSGLLSVHFQLHRRFLVNGFLGFIATLLKLIFSFIFLYLGYKVFGVAVALFLSSLLSFIIFYPNKEIGSLTKYMIPRNTYAESLKQLLRLHKTFILKTFVSSLVMALCIVIDTLLAKSLLTSNLAAQYIGMATLAKLFFYTATALCVVIFPYLLSKNSETPKRLILNLFLFTLTIGGILSIFITYLFPIQILNLILGKAYAAEAGSLVYVLIVSITATFASIMINLASLLDSKDFHKNVAFVFVFGGILFAIIQPENITSLSLSLSSLFALASILLYNNCVKKYL